MTETDRSRPVKSSIGAGKIATILAGYAASRVVILLAVGVAMLVKPGMTLTQALSPWDSGWYFAVATGGYPSEVPVVDGVVGQNTTAFFPLYPFLIRWLAELTPLGVFGAGVLLALAGGAVSSVLLWKLVATFGDGALADRATALFVAFPSSFVFSIAYSEGVMLPFAVGSLLALQRRKWAIAGVLAAVATLARPNAVALCFACAWAAVVAIRDRREWGSLLAPALSPIGIVGFIGFLWARTGDPLVSLKTQRGGWNQNVDFGATTFEAAVDVLRQPFDINGIVSTLSVVFVLGGLALLVWWRPPATLTIYAVVVILPVLLSAAISSRPRFALTAFPLVIAYARVTRGWAFSIVLACSGVLLGALTILTLSTLAATP